MKGVYPGDKFMPCPYKYYRGWKDCQKDKKSMRKMLEQIIHLAKGIITMNKETEEKIKKIFGPTVFSIAIFILLYSLTGVASMFYEK